MKHPAQKLLLVLGLVVVFGLSLTACTQNQAPATPTPTTAPTSAPTLAPTSAPTTVPSITPTSNPHVAGADCKKCHTEEHKRWSNTLHAADAAAVLTNTEHNAAELLTDECITCHAPFQAGKLKIGDLVQPVDQKGPWAVVSANTPKWEAIKCEVCHDPTSTAPNRLAFFDQAKQAYLPVKDATELCSQCHQPGTDDSRDLKGSVHEGLQCVACHFQKGSQMSLDTTGSCAACHPKVNPKHPDVTTLDMSVFNQAGKNFHFATCADCHPNGVPK
jgi:hypothetical protein